MVKKVVKLSVNLSEDVAGALKDLATHEGISMTEALRRAIGTEKFLRDEISKGHKVLIEDDEKKLKEIVLR